MKTKIEKSDLLTKQEKIYHKFNNIQINHNVFICGGSFLKSLIYANRLRRQGIKTFRKPVILG